MNANQETYFIPTPYLEELDAKLERMYLDDEDDRQNIVCPRVCYQACCKNFDSSNIYDIDLEFDKYFGDKPYLKSHFQAMKYTKSHVETLHYTPIRFRLCDAITYVSCCHCCGGQLEYGEIRELFEWRVYKNLVCSKECETKMKDEERECFFGKSCKMCDVFSNDGDRPCECYLCNIDGNDEVNHFNRLHETCLTSKDFDKLKIYAKTNNITLGNAVFYSQSCHACNVCLYEDPILYGNTYCSNECEKNVKELGHKCYYTEMAEYIYTDDEMCGVTCDICNGSN